MILEPGSFRVKDYRRAIPWKIKAQAILIAAQSEMPWIHKINDVNELEFDHRPRLEERRYDTVKGDFEPPQHDPDGIEPLPKALHAERTFGRKVGAEKTVTTRGSDLGEAARIRQIKDTEAISAARLASKRGDYEGAAKLLSGVKSKKRLKPKRKWPTRKFPRRKAA